MVRWKRREDSKMVRGLRAVRWQVGKGGRVMKQQGVGGYWFYSRWMQDGSKISFALFFILINETKEQGVLNNFLSCCMDGKTLFRFYISEKGMDFSR